MHSISSEQSQVQVCQSESMSFQGKVVLITGASSGIGAACAEYFAKDGALLALVGRNAEKSATVAKKIQQIGVNVPLVILADISVDSKRIINETIGKYGRLDILINNAAFSIPGTIENMRVEDFDSVMGTNVRGTVLLTQLAVPYLIVSKGNIVNVSSVVGLRAFEGILAYSMSKAALDQFTRCAALELASKGVRVNSVNPAVIDTNFHTIEFGLARNTPEFASMRESQAQMHPIGRYGHTEEVVEAIAFLAKGNAGFVTGVTLPIDGGLSIKSPIGGNPAKLWKNE